MVAPTEQENSLTASNGGPTWPEDRFLSPLMQRRREMAHSVLTKGILQLSPEAAMLPGLSVETHPPPPVRPFLLAQNLKSQGHCWKWHHKLKVVWCIYASITYNPLKDIPEWYPLSSRTLDGPNLIPRPMFHSQTNVSFPDQTKFVWVWQVTYSVSSILFLCPFYPQSEHLLETPSLKANRLSTYSVLHNLSHLPEAAFVITDTFFECTLLHSTSCLRAICGLLICQDSQLDKFSIND